MPKVNLVGMNVEALLSLRTEINDALEQRRGALEQQLQSLGMGSSVIRRGGRGGSVMKGIKVAPKYRSPEGETWAGRGATPRWLKAALKEGKKIEDFLIDKTMTRAVHKTTSARRATSARRKAAA